MKPRPTSPVTPLEFLYGRINYERTSMPSGGQGLKLDRMRDLLRALGNPHFALPSVHVAGTKGKGSTAVMFSSVAAAAGIRTGLYTSPHLHAIEERIAIDGRPIPTAEFLALLAQVRDAVHVLDRHWVEAGPVRRFSRSLLPWHFCTSNGRRFSWPSWRSGWAAGLIPPMSVFLFFRSSRRSASITFGNWAIRWRRSPRKKPGSSNPEFPWCPEWCRTGPPE